MWFPISSRDMFKIIPTAIHRTDANEPYEARWFFYGLAAARDRVSLPWLQVWPTSLPAQHHGSKDVDPSRKLSVGVQRCSLPGSQIVSPFTTTK